MASNIDTSTLNINYPEAGKDNDTQGFRNNFESIRDNIDVAKTELEDLQENVARTDADTDFNSNLIVDANFLQTTESVFDLGSTQNNVSVDFRNGSYQTVEVGANIELGIIGWPEKGRLANLTVQLLSDGALRNVSITTEDAGEIKRNKGLPVEIGDSTVVRAGAFPEVLAVPNDTDPVIVKFWTTDGGETVYASYVGEFG